MVIKNYECEECGIVYGDESEAFQCEESCRKNNNEGEDDEDDE